MVENERPPVVEKVFGNLDFNSINLDNVDVNPYEVVVALAKTARDINDKARKYLGPEIEVRPTIMAFDKLGKGDITFIYDEDEFHPAPETPAVKE